jgi:hypothetical protein
METISFGDREAPGLHNVCIILRGIGAFEACQSGYMAKRPFQQRTQCH